MATQSPSTSSASRVLDRITEERFTGLLRVSAHEASGEFWFLAGILDEGRFGVSKGEEARERLLRATQTRFQAELRLPHVSAGFKKPMPASGSFADFRPVVLMRHCESCALTCSLELKGKDRTVRLTYRIGELTSVDSEAGNDALPSLLESDQGTYEFSLPTFELPEGSSPPPAAPKIPLAERVDRLLADEASDAEAKRKAEEAAAAEAKRKTEEAAAAEAKRKAEEAAAAEAKRKAEEAAAAEAKRKAEEAKRQAEEAKRKEQAAAEAKRKAEEAKRKAEEAAAAEVKRKAEQAAAEAKRKAEEEAAEAQRKAEEQAAAEAKRKAEEEAAAAAEAKRKAEEEAAAAAEAQRKAEEEAAAEAQRKAEAAEVESKRKPDKERAAATSKGTTGAKPKGSSQRPSRAGSSKAGAATSKITEQGDEQLSVPTRKGGFPWPLLLLAFVLLGLAYFILMRSGVR